MALSDQQWRQLVADVELVRLARGSEVTFSLSREGFPTVIGIGENGVFEGSESQIAFSMNFDDSDWDALTMRVPKARRQSLLALLANGRDDFVTGDQTVFAQHLHLLRRIFDVLRGPVEVIDRPERPSVRSLAHVTGGYVEIDVDGWGRSDVFVERAGAGRPILLLHTAGSDGRQYHGLMRDRGLLAVNELISFDLPWHGKSDPPDGTSGADYVLDAQRYTDAIAAVITSLNLAELPVIVGASMAGGAVIDFASRHPYLTRGVVSSQAGPRVSKRHTKWLRSPSVNQAVHVPEWTYGLMSPHSPKSERDRVWWGYSQGGFGTYEADIRYYSSDWDIEDVAPRLSGETPPVALLSGVFDYSVPPERTQDLAAEIPNSLYIEMPELGHFPHAENPPVFAEYLEQAIAWINEQQQSRDPGVTSE